MTVLLLMKVTNLFLFAVKLDFHSPPLRGGLFVSSGRSASLRSGLRPNFVIYLIETQVGKETLFPLMG